MGSRPVYLSFDIDGLDPSFCPGTGRCGYNGLMQLSSVFGWYEFSEGTPEIGGLTSSQGLEIVQGCRGLNLIGADLVEVGIIIDHNNYSVF